MTGFDIYESAMLKLGYTSSKGVIDNDIPFKAVSVEAINEIGGDLYKIPPIKNLKDNIAVEENAKSVLSYGVAMMLSFYTGDTEKNKIMTDIFNAKRTALLSGKGKIVDTSPLINGV